MSRFTSTKVINSRWRNNDFVGVAGSTHTFPDAFHEEFLVDWALQISDGSIVITETPTTGVIQMSSLTVGDITLTGTATGFPGAPTIIGTSPISVATAAGTSTVSLNANYSTTSHLHDADYVNVGGDTMSGQLYVSSATTTTTVGFGEIIVAKGTAYGSITVNATDDHLHLRSKNAIEVLEQSGPTMQSLRARGLGVNSSHTYPTLVDDGITFGDDANLYRSGANALKTDDALEVVGSLTNGGTSVSLSTHTHAYQPAGTYVTSVAGTAPIVASTTTAGAATVSVSTGTTSVTVATGNHAHTQYLQDAGGDILTGTLSATGAGAIRIYTDSTTTVNGAPFTVTVAGDTVNRYAITAAGGIEFGSGTAVRDAGLYRSGAATLSTIGSLNVASNLSVGGASVLTTSTAFANIANATATATTISSTTSTAPTDISGLSHVFTPTYNENVVVESSLIYTQSVAPVATVDLISKIIVNGTIVSPQGGFTRLGASHASPTGLTQTFSHTFAAISGTPYTAKVAVYKSSANGTFAASNQSAFTILRVRA